MARRIETLPVGSERRWSKYHSAWRQSANRANHPAHKAGKSHSLKYPNSIAPHGNELIGMGGCHVQLLVQQAAPRGGKGGHLPGAEQHRRHRPQAGGEIAAACHLSLFAGLLAASW